MNWLQTLKQTFFGREIIFCKRSKITVKFSSHHLNVDSVYFIIPEAPRFSKHILLPSYFTFCIPGRKLDHCFFCFLSSIYSYPRVFIACVRYLSNSICPVLTNGSLAKHKSDANWVSLMRSRSAALDLSNLLANKRRAF